MIVCRLCGFLRLSKREWCKNVQCWKQNILILSGDTSFRQCAYWWQILLPFVSFLWIRVYLVLCWHPSSASRMHVTRKQLKPFFPSSAIEHGNGFMKERTETTTEERCHYNLLRRIAEKRSHGAWWFLRKPKHFIEYGMYNRCHYGLLKSLTLAAQLLAMQTFAACFA